MRLYALLCQEVGTRPEDRRLLRELSRSCALPFPLPRRFQGGAPAPSDFLRSASLAVMVFAALVAAARWLA